VMCTSGTPSDRRAITLAASSGTPRVPGPRPPGTGGRARAVRAPRRRPRPG
jgi:hypothetical protein